VNRVYSSPVGRSTRSPVPGSSLWNRVFDVLFPPRCLGCGFRGRWLCQTCIQTAARAPVAVTRPGRELDELASEYAFDGAVRKAVHRLKYGHAPHLAASLAPLLEASVSDLTDPRAQTPDLIVPVPLHHRRVAERGYNQSALLALHLGDRLGSPVRAEALSRLRDTPAQTRLSAAERRTNVRGAFEADPAIVQGRVVLLVDDVTTTGATMLECAAALRSAGATSVSGVTVARAI
jgi:ComF family protein